MKNVLRFACLIPAVFAVSVSLRVTAQDNSDNGAALTKASNAAQQKLERSLKELNQLREEIAAKKVPLSRKLGKLEAKLSDVRREYQQTSRLLDSRTLDLTNLRNQIKSREREKSYIQNLFTEYIRNFETRLHIAEIQLYDDVVEDAKLAPENHNLAASKVWSRQTRLISESLTRIEEIMHGRRFEGTAVDAGDMVKNGRFVLVGPAAYFRSEDGESVGTAEQRLGSLEPTIVSFENPEDKAAAAEVVARGSGRLPLDPTLGNAHKVESTQETLVEHIKKGGPVMFPILGLAGAALLVALYKWIALTVTRKPSRKRVTSLLNAVANGDHSGAKEESQKVGGPVGRMLQAGVEHLREPRDLVEEVMYEEVLSTRLKLQRFLPFVAICAASAPLLGLLGTVTGIINTFKLITVFGSGDVKTLSGGISEALITTEFGLIVAIPSLLLHAFLSRKARGMIDRMEKAAVALVNQVAKTPLAQAEKVQADNPNEME